MSIVHGWRLDVLHKPNKSSDCDTISWVRSSSLYSFRPIQARAGGTNWSISRWVDDNKAWSIWFMVSSPTNCFRPVTNSLGRVVNEYKFANLSSMLIVNKSLLILIRLNESVNKLTWATWGAGKTRTVGVAATLLAWSCFPNVNSFWYSHNECGGQKYCPGHRSYDNGAATYVSPLCQGLQVVLSNIYIHTKFLWISGFLSIIGRFPPIENYL